MLLSLKCNCCDGIYRSLDVHFTGACDNKCAHCVDSHYNGIGVNKPNVNSIVNAIVENSNGIDDVLFLGGEPCLYLNDLLDCVIQLREKTNLKLYVTTAVPYVCYKEYGVFLKLIDLLDGINLSVQHYKEDVAEKIRGTTSKYDRQKFYRNLPNKEKIRINLNIVKPFLHTKEDIANCLYHYDKMKFNSIKLSEIQHGRDVYVSFCKLFNIKMSSPFSSGCQTYLNMKEILPDFSTPVLLKRSCFLCEDSLKASFCDGIKIIAKIFKPSDSKYGVVYEDGRLTKGWI